ncbi:MAG: hypothetical protein DRH24_17365 [Deltaproteobacteria bacterium]|nr:MAG: hypothetical protein DRH24_17365 [Deltaproteobacteria bacterium]
MPTNSLAISRKPSVILSNTLAQLVAKGVAVILTLLSTTYIIRLGGSELFGEYTKALALITIGFTAIDFGLNAQAVRSMKGSLSSQRQVLASTLLARLILALITILILNILIFILPGGYSSEIKSIFWLGSLAILFQGLYTSSNAWFQRHLEYWRSSLAIIFATTLGTALTIYYLLTSPTLKHLLLAFTIGYFVMGLTSLFLLNPNLPRQFSFTNSLSHLKKSLLLGGILILSVIASKLDVIILGIFRSSNIVGEYGFAYRVFDVAIILPVFVMNTVYPLLVTASVRKKQSLINSSLKTLTIIGFLGILFLYPLAPLIYLVKPGLNISVSTFRILILFLPLFYASAPLMWQLIEAKREKSLLILYFLAALLNTILNLVFVPHYGVTASALLTGVTELFILIGLLTLRKKL